MINIMVTQKSPTDQNIQVEDYFDILEFLSKTAEDVGIIGNEPTSHPQFDKILKQTNKYCNLTNTDAFLFTNGENIEQYLPQMSNNFTIVLNCNSLANEDIIKKIIISNKKIIYQYNLYKNTTNFSELWELVDKYNITELQTSLTLPINEYVYDKEKYYNQLKPVFLKFCRQANRHKCKIKIMCNHIPYCYFTLEEKEIVDELCEDYQDLKQCNFEIIIDSNKEAKMCLGTTETVPISSYKDIEEVYNSLIYKSIYPRVLANHTGKCTVCTKADLFQCQGGCLYFADIEEE